MNKCGWLILLGWTVSVSTSRADLKPSHRLNGGEIAAVLSPRWSDNAAATLRLVDGDGKPVGLATSVRSDGLMLAKASDLEGLDAWYASTAEPGHQGSIVALDRKLDLALIRVPITGLPVVRWAEQAPRDRGRLVVAPVLADPVVRLGVTAAHSRAIERTGGVLGVQLGLRRLEDGGVQVRAVMDESGAQEAGVLPGDIILSVNEQPVASIEALKTAVSAHDAGETLALRIRRGSRELEVSVLLGHHSVVFGMFNRNQVLSGATSKRKSGFSEVIQHDVALEPWDMGGPLLDLDGLAIGVNIAKVNRVEYLALPVEVLRPALEDLLAKAEAAEAESQEADSPDAAP